MAGRSRSRKRKKRKGSRIMMLALITGVWMMTVWGIAGGTLGKYVIEKVSGVSAATAEKFYFVSSQLKPDAEGLPEYDLTWWDTARPFTFEIDIRNTLEQLNIAGRDIRYTVTAGLGAEPPGASLTGISAAVALKGSPAAVQPWLLSGKTRQEHTAVVTLSPPAGSMPSNLDTVMVTVTANSSSYIQTLRAVYKVHISKDSRINYYVNDKTGNLAAELFFEIRDAMPSHTAEAALTWPAELYPDQSSELFGKLAITGNTGRGVFNTGGKYRLLFMKPDTSKVYTESQIKAELP